MEYEIEKTVCKKCEGVNKCKKYCEMHACVALVNYLNSIDTIETFIGDLDCRERGGKQDLVVSGHRVDGKGLDYSKILTDVSTVLDATSKFNNIFDKTPVQILNMCRQQLGMTAEQTQSMITMVSKLAKNRLLILPFKPEQQCSVTLPKGEHAGSESDAEVKSIIWRTDKDTHKLIATIHFSVKKIEGKSIKYTVSEYIEKFQLKSMSLPIKGDKRDNAVIRMTDYGLIKPILVKSKKQEMCIDGTYLYDIGSDNVKIVGIWNNKNELVMVDEAKGKALTKINENIGFIRAHRKYIAPYLFCDANVLEVK